jgi:hypothetical protein
MTAEAHLPALAIALLLPWLAGTVTVRRIVGPAPATLLLGHGFMLGQLLVILLALAWNRAGLTFAFTPMAITLAGFSAIIALAQNWRDVSHRRGLVLGWRDALWLVPLALFLAERGVALTQEILLRPLFAWDAWMNWVPRAVVWFHQGAMAPFVLPEAWLTASADTMPYTLGNPRANLYPPGIPLLVLWQMLAAGTHDSTLLYLPWLLLPAALALALWGHLRQHDVPRPFCALAVFALLSQPLANTHVALPGYADLWLGVAFALGAMALAEWHRSNHWRWGLLAATLALCCALFKVPGLGFAGLLVVGAGVLAWKPPERWITWAVVTALALLLIGLLVGLHPASAQFLADNLAIPLPEPLPTLRIAPAPLLPLLWDNMFLYGNWHLFWLLLAGSLAATIYTRHSDALRNIACLMFVGGLGLLLAVFGLTHYFNQVANGVTFDRSMLYVVPLGVYVAFALLANTWGAEQPAEQRG